jgi:cell division septum initiation protein DivIVA
MKNGKILKNAFKKAAQETTGKKRKFRSRKGLRIWNEEIEKAIEEKQKAYEQWLQQNTEESKDIYKEKRNHAKTIIREAHQQSCDKFISNIEDYLHGRQIYLHIK